MPFRPPNALLDPLSFALGFLAGSLFWFLLGRIRSLWQEAQRRMGERRQEQEERRARSVGWRYRQGVLRRAQGLHLAAPLFALDEILVRPTVLAPPLYPWPGEEPPPQDTIEEHLPYLPSWPELGTTYGAPYLEMPHLLQSETPLALLAPTGQGKTVALAYLASLLARQDEHLGEDKERVPILLHVSELDLPLKAEAAPLEAILAALQRQHPDLNEERLRLFIQTQVRDGQAVLLLDGYDELPPEAQSQVSEFLKALQRAQPRLRIITTVSPESSDGLLNLGFALLALRPWNRDERRAFLQRWGELWEREIAHEVWASSIPQVEALLLNAWLEESLAKLSPLELTLKVWGAYAGDLSGPRPQDALLTHIRRLTPAELPIAAAETLAIQMLNNLQPHFGRGEAREWLRSFEPPEEEIQEEAAEVSDGEEKREKRGKRGAPLVKPSGGAIGKLIASGLIAELPREKAGFVHPALGYFLAARGLSAYGMEETLFSQPEWSGKWDTWLYLAGESEASETVIALLAQDLPPLYRLHFSLGRTLRYASPKSAWRGKVLAALGKLFQDETLPFTQRAEAMLALALSQDAGSATLFRYHLRASSATTLALAALGCGLMRDEKAIEPLVALLQSRQESLVRVALCLALVAIATPAALEAVARALLEGDEALRRIAAEALANDPSEGYATLQDGLEHEDVLLRRAVVHGLARVPEAWAESLLQKVQVEDDHWMVRNAASSALERKTQVRSRLPRSLTPPSETPWLLEFAAKQGVGIAPGSPATEILIRALREGETAEQLAALAYLKRNPSEGILAALYPLLYDPTSPAREAAYQALWEIALAGVKLPHPKQYGLG